MLIIAQLSFVADILSSIHTDSAWLFPFVVVGNYTEGILNTILLPIYFCYVCGQITKPDVKLKRRVHIVLWTMATICITTVISNAFTDKIFYFDTAKVYHRGSLFVLPMAIVFAMMVIIEVFIISQKEKIEPHYYRLLLLFLIPPLIGWALQLFIYGLPFSLLGITFASLVLFTNIQNRSIDQDYLTGVFNRKMLDNFIQKKINASTDSKTFSGILLDIDKFKYINDHFGHIEGDKALMNTAHILRNSLKFTDFIARYGGDEFCIILESDDHETVQNTILQINSSLINYNQREDVPYQLSFSFGYAIYNRSMGTNPQSFIKVIDEEMYKQKIAHRS